MLIRAHSQLVTAVSLAFTLVFVSVAAIGASWSEDQRQPRITLLGAGDAVSVFVTSGAARLLIVASGDPADLGNALQRARRPGLSRLDILLASDHGWDRAAATRGIRTLDPRYVGIIGRSERFLSDGVRVTETIDRPRELVLPGDMRVRVETSESADQHHWRAVIAHGDTVVVIVSDAKALSAFPQPRWAAMTVFARGTPGGDETVYSGAIAVSAEINPDAFRDVLHGIAGSVEYGVRIHDEEAVRLDFVDGGLRLPDHGVISALEEAPETT